METKEQVIQAIKTLQQKVEALETSDKEKDALKAEIEELKKTLEGKVDKPPNPKNDDFWKEF